MTLYQNAFENTAAQNYIFRAIVNNAEKKILILGTTPPAFASQLRREKCRFTEITLDPTADQQLPESILSQRFNAVVALYTLSILPRQRQLMLLQNCSELLRSGGNIYIGDAVYSDSYQRTRRAQDTYRINYAVIRAAFHHTNYRKLTADAGVIIINDKLVSVLR